MRRMLVSEIKDRILYEDREILVFHKPGGLPVQSADSGVPDLESMARNYLNGKQVWVVHRLDQPVEGITLLAKTARAAKELGSQLRNGEMEKIYLAAVLPGESTALPREGETVILEDYLIRDGRTNMSRIAGPGDKGAKKAVLCYRVAAALNRDDLSVLIVEISLKTGRHHQIRVQFAHAGMPLAGDRKYGRMGQQAAGDGGGIALCAAQLTFRHPGDGRKMHFEISPEHPLLYMERKECYDK